MTVGTNSSRVSYDATVTGLVSFPVPFRFLRAQDLRVVRRTAAGVASTLILGTHYSVVGADQAAGGTVNLVTGLAIGDRLTIGRVTTRDQALVYVPNDPFPAKTHEHGLDKVTMIAQEAADVESRTLRVPFDEPAGATDFELPAAPQRANTVVTFDLTGKMVAKPIGSFPAGPTGASDNTYTTLAALLASDPARKVARLAIDPPDPNNPNGNFTYENGAWRRQSGTGVAYRYPVAGAIERDLSGAATVAGMMPQDFGGLAGGANDQAALDLMLSKMTGPGVSGKYRVTLPYGVYGVEQLRINAQGGRYDFNHGIFSGITATPKKSAVDLRCGSSWVNGLKVSGPFSKTLYECGVHHYTNDLALYYPGFLDVDQAYVQGFEIAWCIGALPSQGGVIQGQTAHRPDDEAIDAPLSELTYTNVILRDCPIGMRVVQPNGKLIFIGCRIHSEVGKFDENGVLVGPWAPYALDKTCALQIGHLGTEVSMIGGFLEHVQGGENGTLISISDGMANIVDVAIETTTSSFIDGTGVLRIVRPQVNGLNSASRSYIEVGQNAKGSFLLQDALLLFPYGRALVVQQPAAVRCCTGPAQGSAVNPGFVATFERVHLDGAPLSFTGATYRPIVRGVRGRFVDCTVSARNGDGTVVLYKYRLHDGADRLAPANDTTFTKMPAYPGAPAGAYGGVTLTYVGGTAGGSFTGDLPPVDDVLFANGMQLDASVGGTNTASFAKAPLKRDGLSTLRMFLKRVSAAGVGTLTIRAQYYQSDNNLSVVRAADDLFSGNPAEFFDQWQPVTLLFAPPKDATQFAIIVEVSNGASIKLIEPTVR